MPFSSRLVSAATLALAPATCGYSPDTASRSLSMAPLEAVHAKVPNATTRKALDRTYRGEGLTHYEDLNALKKALS